MRMFCEQAAVSRTGISRAGVLCTVTIESLTSISVNLLLSGVAFLMTSRYGFSVKQNLWLMMTLSAAYAVGALATGRIAGRFSKRATLLGMQFVMLSLLIPLALAGMGMIGSIWLFIPLLVAAMMVSTLTWPIIESILSENCDSRTMSRRITLYNLVWSITSVIVIAAYGTLLQFWPMGPIVVPIICHSLCLALGLVLRRLLPRAAPPEVEKAVIHVEPDAELLQSRVLALWLSRISLPASFVVANSLMAMYPTMPVAAELGKGGSLLASLWMVGRVAMFALLGVTTVWHHKPRWLLGGGILLLLSYLAIVIPGERLGIFAQAPLWSIVTTMAAGEVVLGLMAGFVFSSSLYFGMVLSEGSTDHGGYHEALIGAGGVVGPGLAAVAQQLATGGTHLPGIAAVCGLMLMTISAAAWITVRK
jgi:MFS family permease